MRMRKHAIGQVLILLYSRTKKLSQRRFGRLSNIASKYTRDDEETYLMHLASRCRQKPNMLAGLH